MIDLFLGEKNKEIQEKATKLGFSEIFFVKVIATMKDFDNSNNYDCCLIKTDNLEVLRRMMDKSVSIFKKIIVLGTTNEINRVALENKKVFALLDPGYERKKDFLDSRDSGLNQVLCKIAKENEKKILISFDSLRNEISLGRTIQNFRLCKKFENKIQIVNFCSSLDEMKSVFELKEIERVLKSREHFEHPQL